MHNTTPFEIVIPARNEAANLAHLLTKIRHLFPEAEILLVNDGSHDDTARVALESGAQVITHPHSIGNGAAIKTGARLTKGDVIVFMDADGQHDPADIEHLLNKLNEGYDMAVGARVANSHASWPRRVMNGIYNRLASWITGQSIDDLTSGFRAVHADKFREFLPLLPNGFSYPTTITMAFCRAGYSISYVPIRAGKRLGRSHIRPLRDGLAFLVIIFKIGSLYSPMKIFLPFSLLFFSSGVGLYAYTFVTEHRFTNMGALLLTTALLVFLIGLVSEQITNLLYSLINRQNH